MYSRLAFQHYFCKIKFGYNFKSMNFVLCYSFEVFKVNSQKIRRTIIIIKVHDLQN